LRKKRFLLTKNTRDFIDDRKLPWENTYGVIAISGSFSSLSEYSNVLFRVIGAIVPYGEVFQKSKIQVSPEGFTIKARNARGELEIKRYRDISGTFEEWSDR
jgi:hypothetical protein